MASRAKIYEVAFQIGGKLQSSFSGSMLNAQKNLNMLNQKVTQLERGGKDVERFKKLKKDVQGTENELRNAQEEFARLSKAINTTDDPSKKLKENLRSQKKELGNAQLKVFRLAKAFDEAKKPSESLKESLRTQRKVVQESEKDIARLTREIKGNENASRQLQRNYNSSIEKIKKLKERLLGQRTETAKVSREMGKAGVSTKSLAADQTALEKRLNQTRVAQQKLNKVMLMQQANKKDRSEKRASLFDAAAMGGSLAFPMMFAARFEQSMAEVRAISGATDKDFATLTAQAKQLGATTSFSASEAAGGMKYLAMAGFKTNQVIAAMPGLLSMARAGGTDLAMTSDIASDIMSGFGIKADQMNRVADVLTQTFTTSNTTLGMLGETMKYVGPVATKAGMGLEEAAAMAGLLGNVGIKASQSGTVLKGMILRLAAPTGKAAKSLKSLGVEALDARGDVRPLIDILGEVAKATSNMGSGEQLGHLKAIFGEEPAAGMAELIGKEGENGITKYLEVIKNSQGKAGKIAAIMDKTLIGSMKRLGSAGEGLAISVGSTLIPAMTYLANSASWVTSKIIALTTRFPKTTSAVAIATAGVLGLSVAAMAGGYAMTFITAGVLNTAGAYNLMQAACTRSKLQLIALTIQQKASAVATGIMTAAQWAWNVALNANPIGLAITGIAALSAGAIALYQNFKPFTILVDNTWALIRSFGGGIWSGLVESFNPVLTMFTEMKIAVGSAFNEIGIALSPLFSVFSGMKASVGAVFSAIGTALSPIKGYFAGLIGPIDASSKAMSGFAVVGKYIGKTFGLVLKTALLPILATIKMITVVAKTMGAIKRFFTGDKEKDSKDGDREDISRVALGGESTPPNLNTDVTWNPVTPVAPHLQNLQGQATWNPAVPVAPKLPNLKANAAWNPAVPVAPELPNLKSKASLDTLSPAASRIPDIDAILKKPLAGTQRESQVTSITVSPVINIKSGTQSGKNEIKESISLGMMESEGRLKEIMERIDHDRMRVSYA